MKLLLHLLALSVVLSAHAQNRKGELRLLGEEPHRLYVVFAEQHSFPLRSSHLESIAEVVPEAASLLNGFPHMLDKGIPMDTAQFEALAQFTTARKQRPDALKRLRNTYVVELPGASNQQRYALASALEALPQVAYCELISPEPVKPPSDIMPATPNLQPYQMYLGANPGVNMQYAWNMGLTGQGIRMRDVEYGFNKNHEEFYMRPGAQLAPGMTVSTNADGDYVEHGTAVVGVLYADPAGYGVTGMAHGAAEILVYPEYQQTGYNRVLAVSNAVLASVPGDVIVFEMQTAGQNTTAYVPAEYSNLIWDLTKAATDAGIHVVAAAGNGNQNLGWSFYAPYINRGDSGALIVGGGTPNLAHNKISYSTYGSRVNVQGWAEGVATSGYGDWQIFGNDINQQYTMFSGTSSATPIVAGCVVVLQSYYFSLTGEYLSPMEMRSLLVATGIPQGSGGPIGPLPNMETAIAAIQQQLSVNTEKAIAFAIYPNPATDYISFSGPGISDRTSVEILNGLGQRVFTGILREERRLSVSELSSGVYFARISANGQTLVKKFVKH